MCLGCSTWSRNWFARLFAILRERALSAADLLEQTLGLSASSSTHSLGNVFISLRGHALVVNALVVGHELS